MKSAAASLEAAKRHDRVFFITEPSGRKCGAFRKPNYQYFGATGPETVRAALALDRSMNAWKVEQFTSPDCCVVAVKISGKQVYLCSSYLDITKSVNHPDLLACIKHCNRFRIPLIVGMDSNAHSPLWQCEEANARGSDLEEMILTLNMNVMNSGHRPTFVSSRAESIIDVTMVNASALALLDLDNWRVDQSMTLSDHKYILFSIGNLMPVREKFRNLKKVNWDDFRMALDVSNLPREVYSYESLAAGASQLQKCLTEALDKVAPLKPAHNPGNPWWTEELSQIRTELLELHKKRNRTEEGLLSFRNLRKLYQRQIRREKRNSWRSFVTKAESAKEISKIIRILRPKPQTGISLFGLNGVPLTAEETLENLMDTHFLESRPLRGEETGIVTRQVPHRFIYDEKTRLFIEYISADKVAESLGSFGPSKAAGPDGFKPLVLQNAGSEIHEYISILYKWAITLGIIPDSWLEMKVVFLPKAGKSDYGNAKSYRPITLSNFILKGLERLVQWYVTEKTIPKPLYAQHAYTANRSCDSAISEAWDVIERSVLQGQHALAVSLDCSGAFDRIEFASANRAMERKKIPPGIISMYNDMLTNRSVRAELQGESCVRNPRRGSPQGGVLSPLIWILIMDEILTQFSDSSTRIVGYADDLLLITRGTDPTTLIEEMEKALKKVLNWGAGNGLVFNPSKTSCVRFSLSKRLNPWREVKMDGKELPYEPRMKYLGVTLHRSMGFSTHLKEKVAKATKIISLANSIIGQQWGLSPEKALWTYLAVARPIVLYGSLVWAASTTETMRRSLEKLQRKALLCLTASMRSTPTRGMEVVLGLPPLDLECERAGVLARLRTRLVLLDRWDGVGRGKRIGHKRFWDNIADRCKISNLPLDTGLRQRYSAGGNDDVIDPDLTLYTDGSKMESGVGCGWAACHGDTIVWEDHTYLGKHSSVFQAEVTAIEQALGWAANNCDKGTSILIQSDSQAAIQAILGRESRSSVVLSCVNYFRKAKENLRVALRWIRGHADNTGNELADSLAREGSNTKCHSVEPELPLPHCAVKGVISRHFLAKWQRRWAASDSCRQTKIFFPEVSSGKLKKLAKWTRTRLNLLVQVGTGHALVANHLCKWTEILNECSLCLEEEESIEHLFYDCPALWRRIVERKAAEIARAARQEIPAAGQTEWDLVKFFSEEPLVQLFRERSDALESHDR